MNLHATTERDVDGSVFWQREQELRRPELARKLGGYRKRKMWGCVVVLTFFLGTVVTGCRSLKVEEVRTSREISGLALLSETRALCVHDAKADIEAKDPRMGVIDSSVFGGSYRAIDVTWPKGELASDLEAICKVPDRASEFLVAESGYWTNQLGQWNRAGRLFRMACREDGAGVKAKILQIWRWPAGMRDIEGIACAVIQNRTVLFAANRTGTIYTAHLQWEQKNDVPIRFVQTNVLGENVLPEFRRKIGDLYLDASKNLWAVATVDSADTNEEWNDGPFQSVIYQLGAVSTNLEAPIQFHSTVTNAFVIDGLKVEGLTASILNRGLFTLGSDDEDLGGVWRVVGESVPR